MAMTTDEMRRGIATLCEKDRELASIHAYLDKVMDWPLQDIFQLMVLIDELKGRMREEVSHFSFRKKDGTVRQAYGTRASEVIVRHEGAVMPPEKQRQCTGCAFPYFDIERQAWRSFRVDNLMDIDRGYTL